MKVHTPGLPSRYTDGDHPTAAEPAGKMAIPPAERRFTSNINRNIVNVNNPQALVVNSPLAHSAAASAKPTVRHIQAAIAEAKAQGINERTPDDGVNPKTGKKYPIAPPTGEPSVLLRDNVSDLPAMAGFKEQHDALVRAVHNRPADVRDAAEYAKSVAGGYDYSDPKEAGEHFRFRNVAEAKAKLLHYKRNPDQLKEGSPEQQQTRADDKQSNMTGEMPMSPSIAAQESTAPDLVVSSNAATALDAANLGAPMKTGESSADLAAALAQAGE